jgi:hypothetical protein
VRLPPFATSSRLAPRSAQPDVSGRHATTWLRLHIYVWMQARYRTQGTVIDVPIEPVLQPNEMLLSDAMDSSARKFGLRVMAEKLAGSGVFYRAFVKASKTDRVLLFFPEDADPCILEWVYKASSRIYRSNSGMKASWKYQGNGAWKLTEKSKKKAKSCRKPKPAGTQQQAGTALLLWARRPSRQAPVIISMLSFCAFQ